MPEFYIRTRRDVGLEIRLGISVCCECMGIDSYVGSIAPGKVADIVFWRPDHFIARPELILKGGFITWAAMGDPAATLMTAQPFKYRPQWGYFGRNPRRLAYSFVTQAAIDAGLADKIESQPLLPVKSLRSGRNDGERRHRRAVLAEEVWQAHEAVYAIWETLRPEIAGKAARRIRKP